MAGKKKRQQLGISTGGIIAIVFGAIVITAIIASAITGNIDSQDEENYSPPVYTEQAEVEENDFFNGNDFFEEQSDLEYEKADAKWRQYVNVLESDEEKLDNVIEISCSGDMSSYELELCINQISPILNAYVTHIQNAQIFMHDEGEIFANDIELLGYLDDKIVYADTLTNQMNTAVEVHNAQQTSSSEMISDDELMEILKIMAMFI
jgi:hypothetical protein